MNGSKALLLVGSPRGMASASHSLGNHLLSRLEERGMAIKKLPIYPALADEKKMIELLTAVDSCHLLILAFPLYVDQLPAPLISLLLRIADRRQGRPADAGQALAAVVNCGFPETVHCAGAAEVTRIFAGQAGFRFLGCLSLGMGGAIGNRELLKAGGVVRHQIKALDQAAGHLAAGGEIPAAVIGLMGRAMMPRWFYNLASDWGWKSAARKNKVSRRLNDLPYSGG
jgi:hypothetical protein